MSNFTQTTSATIKPVDNHLSLSMKVEQISKDLSIFPMLTFAMLFSLPGFWLMFISIGSEFDKPNSATLFGTLGFFGGLILGIIGLILGFFVWFYIEDYFNAKKGNPKSFSKNTLVIIDENGLQIEGLGLAKWPEVLSLEAIEDADNMLIVYTSAFGKLMFHHDIYTLVPIINGYLNAQYATNLEAALNNKQQTFTFKAVMYSWRRFFAWILFGYFVALIFALFMFFASKKSFFATTFPVVICSPIIAYMTWSIAFWQISLLAGKRTKSLDMTQDRLISKDKTIDVNLQNAKVTFHHKKGIGYSIYFMCVKPQTGRQIDLLVEQDEWFVLQKNINDD